jgi:hypothetical protein
VTQLTLDQIHRQACENRLTMPSTSHAILDLVELLVESGRWSAGTVATLRSAAEPLTGSQDSSRITRRPPERVRCILEGA